MVNEDDCAVKVFQTYSIRNPSVCNSSRTRASFSNAQNARISGRFNRVVGTMKSYCSSCSGMNPSPYCLATVSIVLAIPVVVTFLREGIVPRLPTAVLATGLMLAAFLCIASGLVLDTVTRGRREMKLLAYLQQKVPGED